MLMTINAGEVSIINTVEYQDSPDMIDTIKMYCDCWETLKNDCCSDCNFQGSTQDQCKFRLHWTLNAYFLRVILYLLYQGNYVSHQIYPLCLYDR